MDTAMGEAVDVSQPTSSRIRNQFVAEGREAARNRRAPRRVYARKRDGEQEAPLIALPCGEPPPGHLRWSLRLLAPQLGDWAVVEAISYQTVRRTLKYAGVALRGVPASRSQAPGRQAGDSPPPQARQLAQHRGD